uniref:Putative secreted peptide n=1 Tax=Triatoma infestans TaxID=30076 RepID=A0A023EWS8_TRIIF
MVYIYFLINTMLICFVCLFFCFGSKRKIKKNVENCKRGMNDNKICTEIFFLASRIYLIKLILYINI